VAPTWVNQNCLKENCYDGQSQGLHSQQLLSDYTERNKKKFSYPDKTIKIQSDIVKKMIQIMPSLRRPAVTKEMNNK